MQTALEQTVAYVWKHMPCEHLRVEILHIKDSEGKLAADAAVKACYSALGFRWKTLTNDPATGIRAQIMQLANPSDRTKIDEPFSVKIAMTISLQDAKVKKQAAQESNLDAPISSLSLGLHPIKL